MSDNQLSRPRATLAALAGALTLTMVSTGCDGTATEPATSVASVTVQPGPATILVQGAVQLSATLRDANGAALFGRPITWTSDNALVATVDENGMVMGRGAGSATVTATSEGVSGTAAITVIAFSAVSAGGGHTCGLTTHGAAYCWGANDFGYLGDGTTTARPSPVAVSGGLTFAAASAGFEHTCGLTTGGTAYCWGANTFGFLGDGTTTPRTSPVAVSGGLTFAAVSAGAWHACGVTEGGAAYCWGHNFYGQLGDGTSTDRTSPVAVSGGLTFAAVSAGAFHTCGVTTSGAAYCWGGTGSGELGDGTSTDRTSPVAVWGGLTFAAVSAGYQHTCGVTTNSAAYCWGYNGNGQLGDGTRTDRTSPVAVSGGLTFAAVSTEGGYHTCGVTTSGAAYCWGHNWAGELGNGDGTGIDRTSPVAVSGGLTFAAVSAGPNHTCGVTTSGAPYCWGWNSNGELGDGSATQRLVPTAVAFYVVRVDGEWDYSRADQVATNGTVTLRLTAVSHVLSLLEVSPNLQRRQPH